MVDGESRSPEQAIRDRWERFEQQGTVEMEHVRIHYAALSVIGLRDKNDDRFMAGLVDSRDRDGKQRRRFVGAVGDGIGSARNGGRTAEVALKQFFIACERDADAEQAVSAGQSVVVEKNKHAEPEGELGGSTFTGIIIDEYPEEKRGEDRSLGTVDIGHVGDSAAYGYRNGRLFKLTSDQTIAEAVIQSDLLGRLKKDIDKTINVERRQMVLQEYAIALQITDEHLVALLQKLEEQPHNDDVIIRNMFGHMIKNFIGQRTPLQCEHKQVPYRHGDVYMLCSDGLHGYIPAEWMMEEIERGGTPQEIAVRLVERTLKNGGNDNITVVIMRTEEK